MTAEGKCPLKLCGIRAEVEAGATTGVRDPNKGKPEGTRIWGEEKHMEKIWSVEVRLRKPTLTFSPWDAGGEILHVPAQRTARPAIGGQCWAPPEEGQGMGRTRHWTALLCACIPGCPEQQVTRFSLELPGPRPSCVSSRKGSSYPCEPSPARVSN